MFNCYRKKICGKAGNIYSLLKKLGRTKEFLSEHEVNAFEKLHGELREEGTTIDLEMDETRPPLMWRRVYDDPYLRSRGFRDQEFQKYEVGRSKYNKDYVTFLVRRDGKLVGYIGRADKSKEWIDAYNAKVKNEGSKLVFLRYDNSTSDFSKTLFGIDEVVEGKTDTVILVEGIFSKIQTDINLELDSYDTIKCCATFGAKFSDEQAELLRRKGIKFLYFWFEADVLNKIKPIVARASAHFVVRVSYLDGFDPADIDAEQALELFDSSRNWLDFNTSYLKINLQ